MKKLFNTVVSVFTVGGILAGTAALYRDNPQLPLDPSETLGTVIVSQMLAPVDSGMTAYNGKGIVTGGSVNIRSGPSANYSIIGVVKKGATLTVVGKFSNNWYKVQYKNGYGYITGQYLSVTKVTSTTTTTKPTTAATTVPSTAAGINVTPMKATAYTTDNLNARTGNGTKYSRLGVLKKGTKIDITGKCDNNWYQIKYNGSTAYVCGDYIRDFKLTETTTATTQPSTQTTAPSTTQTTTAQQNKDYEEMSATAVTSGNVNARAGNGTQYGILGVVSKGTKIQIVGRYSNNWYKIVYKNGYACVSGTYVANIVETPGTPEQPGEPENPGIDAGMSPCYCAATTTTELNVRTGPSTKYGKIGVLPKGTVVGTVGKFSSNWYKIVWNSGYAYVCGDYLTTTPADPQALFTPSHTLQLYKGITQKIQVYDLFSNGGKPEFVWKSSDTSVALVDASGNVTGMSGGNATITVTEKNSGRKTTVAVAVLAYKASARISGVPIYNQLTSGYPTGCEQFSTRMLVNFYGYGATTNQIVNAIGLSKAPYKVGNVTYGGDPSISFVGDPTKKKPYGFGCLPSAMVRGVNNYMANVNGRHHAVDITGCDIEKIYSYISQGIPVVAGSAYLPMQNNPYKDPAYTWIIDGGANKGKSVTWWRSRHVMVVVGYDSKYIYCNDPCFNTVQAYDKAEWIADWKRVDRHAFVMLEN